MLEMECLQGLFSKTINITMEKLYIELTNRCNLKCAHCYNDSNNGICFDLPFDNITDMLEYAKECKLKSIALSGGEALLYPHISDVFEKCKELELDVLLLTNGTYFENEKYFNILFKYLPDIQVSLDGPDANSNDKIRGSGNFERAISFIKRLKKYNYPRRITVNTVLNEHTVHVYRDMLTVCSSLGVDELTYSFLTMAGRAKSNVLPIADSDFYNVVKDINTNIKPNPDNKCQGVGVNHLCSLTSVHDSIIKLQPKVTFKGEVFPCQMQHNSEYMIGNINTHTLKQILDSNDVRRFLALMFLRKYYMKECNACLFKSICGRGCMAKSINDCGNPFVVDGCCQFYKELIVVDILKRLTYN